MNKPDSLTINAFDLRDLLIDLLYALSDKGYISDDALDFAKRFIEEWYNEFSEEK